MKLYNDDGSPFAARVRLQVYHKDLPITLTSPPGGARSEEYRRINPLGLIPALETPEGLLSESLAILEYLEDLHAEPPLRADSAFGRASQRRLMLYHDDKIQPLLGRLFRQVVSGGGDREAVDTVVSELQAALTRLDAAWPADPSAPLSLPDCVLVPTLHYTGRFMGILQRDDVLTAAPTIRQRHAHLAVQPAVQRVTAELDGAMERLLPDAGAR